MPVQAVRDRDTTGRLRYAYRWGNQGKRYYFNPISAISREVAKDNAIAQGQAIKASLPSTKAKSVFI